MRERRAVRATDVQRLLSIVIDVCTASASPLQRKQALLAALCETFRARIGEITEVAEGPAPQQRRFTSFVDHGWDHHAQGQEYVQRCERMNLTDPLSERLLRREDEAFNIRREDVVEDGDWFASAYVNDILRPADLDSILGCYRRFHIAPLGAGGPPAPAGARNSSVPQPYDAAAPQPDDSRVVGIGVGLHRPWSDKPFSSRDVALLAHVNQSLVRLYPYVLFDDEEHVWRTLSPRLRQVLDHLLEGMCDKDIGDRIGLSRHTVHEYAAKLYKRFGVDGRTSLLAKMLGRMKRD